MISMHFDYPWIYNEEFYDNLITELLRETGYFIAVNYIGSVWLAGSKDWPAVLLRYEAEFYDKDCKEWSVPSEYLKNSTTRIQMDEIVEYFLRMGEEVDTMIYIEEEIDRLSDVLNKNSEI